MKIIYTLENDPVDSFWSNSFSVFLAGPTPRNNKVKSWRPEAVKLFEDLDYKGKIYYPETKEGRWEDFDKDEIITWELGCLGKSSVIMFWIPRNMKTMPALTTNVEFGYWIRFKNVVLGYPDNAVHMNYLEFLYNKKYNEKSKNSLRETVDEVMKIYKMNLSQL
jgi:hypothetical protein